MNGHKFGSISSPNQAGWKWIILGDEIGWFSGTSLFDSVVAVAF